MDLNRTQPLGGDEVERWSQPDRFLRLLSDPWYALLIRLQHVVSSATFAFWEERRVVTIHLPITTNAVSSPMGLGSDSLPVEIDLFGQPTYLADSMQFMLEYACRFHPRGAFYLMPSFRGESADATHLCQFYHSEAELQCDLEQAISTAEAYFRWCAQQVMERLGGELREHAKGVEHIQRALHVKEYPRIRFDEAARILAKEPGYSRSYGKWRTLSRSDEQALLRHVGTPLWVTHWDHLAVPFYQAFEDSTQARARNADFLLGFGEVIGLGERHATADAALDALNLHSVEATPYRWYVDMKKQLPLQTAGFGMGVERFLMWILQHHDIRDLQLLPRFNGVAIVP